MFYVKYACVHSINQHYFESNMQSGIYYDLIILFHTPYYFGTSKSTATEQLPNTMFYIPKNTPYYYSPVVERGSIYEDSLIQFNKDEFFIKNMHIPEREPIYINDSFWMIRLFEFISYHNYIGSATSMNIIDNSMQTIFLMMSDSLKCNYPSGSTYQDKLQTLRKEIYERPDLSWNMNMITQYLNLSRGHVHKLYKDLFGTSCTQDIINSRIQKSKYLLIYSNLSISKICIECGYNNIEHFSRQFTRITGRTPSEYRNLNR